MHWFDPFFDYVCTAWLSNLSNWSKLYLQASQNKCIRFCLQLHKRSRIRFKVFLQLNWLNVHDRYSQFIVSDIFIFFWYFYISPFLNAVITSSSNEKLKLPFRKTKLEIQGSFHVRPDTWKSFLNNLNSAAGVNSVKHYIKEYFLKTSGNAEADIYSYT